MQADFLYGAPASGLTVEGDLRVDVDPVPFPAFNKYSFGLEAEREKFEPPLITLTAPDTDDKGKSKIEWAGDKVKETALPLRGQVQVRVFEPGNGRATKNDKTLPLRTREVYLGIRPTFEGRYAREGAETEFDLVAVDAEGKQVARPSVDYKIERITYSYQWYESDGKWRWQSIQAERLVAADTLAFKADAPTHLAKQLSWGPHRLTINDREANTSTSITFYVGWWGGSGTEDAPDSLRVASDKKNYAPGDTAKLRIEAPFAGEALIAIATDRIVATYTDQGAGRRHHRRDPGEGRMGRRRLCAGDRLAAAQRACRTHADPRRRGGLARPRSGAAHARRADRRAREGDAAPAHRGADPRRQRHRARRPMSRWPRSTRASCSSPGTARPTRPTTTSASAGSASTCATTTASCSTSRPTRSAASASAATPATSAASTSCRRAPSPCSAGR